MIRVFLANKHGLLLTLVLWGCSGQYYPATDVAVFNSDGVLPPNTAEHHRICLSPEALSTEQRSQLDAKVPAAVLERALGSSVLVTFDTLYPNAAASCIKSCSGTLIKVAGKTRVITNQHCFSDNFTRKSTESVCAYDKHRQAETFSKPCLNTVAHVNFPAKGQRKTISLACQGEFTTDKELDLAIFDVDTASLPTDHPHAAFWQGEIAANQEAFLLHHPNCGQENFQPIPGTSMGAMIKTITFEDCQLVTPPAGIEEFLSPKDNTFHSCATMPGSSGAAVLDANTGAILAVHRAMIELTPKQSSNRSVNQIESRYGHGTSLAAVQAFVDETQ